MNNGKYPNAFFFQIIFNQGITEPNKAEDGDESVHGFIETHSTLYLFGGKISSSEQFQKHHWKQIQKYLMHCYDSNQHCDVSVVVVLTTTVTVIVIITVWMRKKTVRHLLFRKFQVKIWYLH